MAVKSLKRAQERIEVKDLKLNALLEVTLAINSNINKQGLFNIYIETLQQLSIEKVALFINDETWDLALSYGIESESLKFDIEKDLLPFEDISEINTTMNGPLKGFDLVIPVYHKTKAIAFLLIGDILNEAIKISPIIKHLKFIQTFTNIIAVAIENKRLALNSIKQERTKKELELASQIQSMMLPTHFPNNPNFQIAAYYQSHQKVGGDYYDVIWLDDENVALCIADVSGKGISAAMLMSNFQANLRVLVKHTPDLKELVNTLNQKVLENSNGDRFITFFIGVYNVNTRTLKYINCGHNPPILNFGNKSIELEKGCPGLGMLDEIPLINIGEIEITPNSKLLCYTDGLTEVENEQDEEYGTARVIDIVENWEDGTMDALNKNLLLNLNLFKKNKPFIDDIALLSCRFK